MRWPARGTSRLRGPPQVLGLHHHRGDVVEALRRVAGVAKGIASGCEAVALIAGTKSQ